MTTDIEKTFFDTFEIDANADICWCEYDNKICDCYYECDENCREYKVGYPQITDRIWLELVRIYASCNIFLLRKNMEDFKYDILTALIERPYEYRKQIKELFKEG